MADAKISALTSASTPLAGTEVLPIVQSSSTKKVTIANLTAGRSIATASITASGEVTSTTNDARFSLYRATGINYFDWASGQTLAFGTQTSQGGGGRVNKVNFTDAGNVEIANGNLVIGTSGKGIDFSATPGTGTSELLSDYEEGACALTLSAGLGTITSSSVTANYTKIGRVVTITGQLLIIDNGTGSSFLNIIGLPFTPAAPAAGVGREGVNNGLTDVIYISNASTTCQMYTTVNGYPVATNSTVNFTMSYITS